MKRSVARSALLALVLGSTITAGCGGGAYAGPKPTGPADVSQKPAGTGWFCLFKKDAAGAMFLDGSGCVRDLKECHSTRGKMMGESYNAGKRGNPEAMVTPCGTQPTQPKAWCYTNITREAGKIMTYCFPFPDQCNGSGSTAAARGDQASTCEEWD